MGTVLAHPFAVRVQCFRHPGAVANAASDPVSALDACCKCGGGCTDTAGWKDKAGRESGLQESDDHYIVPKTPLNTLHSAKNTL